MMMVVVMVVMLMRFMDVVYSVIIICLCCLTLLVKAYVPVSQRISNLITFSGPFTYLCLSFYFRPDRTVHSTLFGAFNHNKKV